MSHIRAGKSLALRGTRAFAAGWAVVAALAAISPTLLAGLGSATTGGPDLYGYVWVDSRPPSPVVPFNWIDIVSRGVLLALPDDGCTFEVGIGFQFRYYGSLVDQLFVCSNGFITFGVPDSFYADPPIPSPSPPNSRVVGLGLDLNPAASGGGRIYIWSEVATTPRRFVVTWNGVYRTATTQPQTFQIVLEQNETTKDGRVFLQYRDLTGVSSALVGIENTTGSSGLAYPGPLEDGLTVAFLPPSDATLPPDTLRVAATTLAPPSAAQGSANVPLVRLDLSTAANDVRVDAIETTLSGLGAGPEDVLAARLWLDEGDGAFVPGADILLESKPFTGSPPKARFAPYGGILVTATAPVTVFVTYDIASTAGVGDWVGARLPDASAIAVGFPDTVGSSGFPIDTYVPDVRTRLNASQDTLFLSGTEPLLPAAVAQWQTDVPALALTLDADRNFVEVTGIRVSLGGNATAWDVWAVKALRDRDADGNYTPDVDEVLAVSVPLGTPPAASLSFPLTVAASSPERILIVLDAAPNATLGNVLNVTVNATDVFLPFGSVDRVDGAAFPAASGSSAIVAGSRPVLRLPWVVFGPRPDGFWQAGEYLLGPDFSASLNRPAGNRVPGLVTAQNNATVLFLAVDAIADSVSTPEDGLVLAFDTDGDGLPTPGADDVFVVNGSAGARLQYNASAGGWTAASPCLPEPGPILAPACAAGFGITELNPSPHRFYEVAIPLGMLGVPDPIPPGTAVRFAVAGPVHGGLADGGNVSTWPLLFGPSPPMGHFADLGLATGPLPNQPPTLNWTGEPGYEADALEPESGLGNETFRWRILYVDPDNDAPAIGHPRLHVFRDGVAVPGSPFEMVPGAAKGGDYRNGEQFRRSLTSLTCGGDYSYHVTVRDARGLSAGTPTLPGPTVWCPDRPPTLSGESVSPLVATAPASFTYRVAYADPEGRPPRFVEADVFRGDVLVGSPTFGLAGWVGAQDDYRAGAWYAGSLLLAEAATNYSYRFRAADDNFTVESPTIFGPYVLAPPPDVLAVAGVDMAPLIVDEGSRLVPFLELYLLTSSPGVNVTAIRVDRTGAADDAEVLRIHAYHDVDESGGLSGPDVPLGSRPPLLGTATFPVSLHVNATSPAAVLFLLDLARPGTPDATVGLEVRDATYISVGPGDAVQAFPTPFRSTRALINVPPTVADPRVDGFPEGSSGIDHVLSATPAFTWQYADGNAGDVTQVAYNVSVSSVSPAALLWSRNATGGITSLAYGGPPVEDGRSYALTVSVSDGRLWSAPATVRFRLNTAPEAPLPFSPPDLATDLSPTVTLLWRPVGDPEGDPITYWYWVSEDVGFTVATEGRTDVSGVTVTLAAGRTYYWKVGASDGYEFAGNATVWRFTTAGEGPPPVRGEVRGRILNGTTPLQGALVELLVQGVPAVATITGENGTFRFRDLDLQPYDLRASAFGFQPKVLRASPTAQEPIVDAGDIVLVPMGTNGGGNGDDGAGGPPSVVPPWLVLLIVVLAVALGASLTLLPLFARRGRGERGTTEAEGSSPSEDAASSEGLERDTRPRSRT